LTVGKTLEEAYFRLEKLEHAAHTLFYAHMLSGRTVSPLGEDALKKLEGLGYR
jgi:ribulose-5-phosphate 4-epimerase/fuculose-1-phosphate aldolase